MADYQNVLRHHSIELLTDYVQGLVNEETRLRIEKDCTNSPELSAIVEGIRSLVQMGHEDPEDIEKVLRDSSSRGKKLIATKKRNDSIGRVLKPLYRIAAVLVLMTIPLGIWFYSESNSLSAIVAEELNSYYAPPVVVRGETDKHLWSQAVQSYKQEDFETATALLSKHVKMQPQDTQALLYLGISALYSADVKKAIPPFEEVLDSQSRFKPQAHWFLALTYLELGEEKMAMSEFEEIQKHPGSFKYDRAKKILSILR